MSSQDRTSSLATQLAAARAAEEAAAHAEAEAGRARAAAADAQRRATEEQEARRRAHSQTVLDTFERDQHRAQEEVDAARKRFSDVARTDLPNAIGAYLEWANAASRHAMVYTRFHNAAGFLGVETWKNRAIPTLPARDMTQFSESLNRALMDAVREEQEAIEEQYQAEIEALLEGTSE